MTTTTYVDLTSRHVASQRGFMRHAFDRMMERRDRQVRRYMVSIASLSGGEHLDLSLIERRSFFDQNGPERR